MRVVDRNRKLRWMYLALVLVEIFSVEIPGARDYAQAPYAGYELSPESANDFNSDYLPPRVITEVRPGSPAERSGLLSGDRVLMVQGIPFEDQERLLTLGRPRIGETRSFIVERNGTPMTVPITYEVNSQSYHLRYTGFAIIAFAFLIVGMGCFWFYPSPATNLLFWLGLTGAFVFMHKPYFVSFAARCAFAMLRWLITSLWLAILFHFLLIFPRPKQALVTRPGIVWASYLPCVGLFFVIAYYTLFPTRLATEGGPVVNVAFLFIGAYLVLGVVAFIHTFMTLSASERTGGVKVMAVGTVIGILPIAVSIIAAIIAPTLTLPGRDYYILTLVFIPLSFGYAVWRSLNGGKRQTAVA